MPASTVTAIGGDLRVTGTLTVDGATNLPTNTVQDATVSSDAAIQRSKLEQSTFAQYTIAPTAWRVWNDLDAILPSTSASDDLGIYAGTFGSDAPLIRTFDLKSAGASTLYARALVPLPAEYDDGESVRVSFDAGMVTTVSDGTATIDLQAYEIKADKTISSDLCNTSAQSINSLTFAKLAFTITSTDLVAGDLLDVRVAVAVADSATGTAVIGAIVGAVLECDVRG